MATKIGGDVILTLMSDVAELRDTQTQMTGHLEALVGLSKAQTSRLERIAKLVAEFAARLNDHEERLSALEARP